MIDKLRIGIDMLSELFFDRPHEVYNYLSHPKSRINSMLPYIVWSCSLLNCEEKSSKYALGVLANLLSCRHDKLEKKYCGRFSESSIAYKNFVDLFYSSPEVSYSTKWMNMISHNMNGGWASIIYKNMHKTNVVMSTVGSVYDIETIKCDFGMFKDLLKNEIVIAPIKNLKTNGMHISPSTHVDGYFDHRTCKSVPATLNHMDQNEIKVKDISAKGNLSTFIGSGFIVEDHRIMKDYYDLQERSSLVIDTLLC